MESTIYEESPLAEYLEGQGEASQDWQTTECDALPESPDRPSYAPKGPPQPKQSRVQKLLSPLRIPKHKRSRTLTALQDVYSAAMSVRVSTSENERFLDQFRYSIIASHLLVQEAKPSSATNLSHQLRDEQTWRHCTNYPFSVHGAAFITTISFLTAWLFHWVTVRSAILPWNIGIIVGLMVIAAIGIYAYARKKALQRSRQRAVNGLTDLITRSHALDSAARSALNLIQEIEIVSRGYEISNPLPPISRLEMKGPDRRCPSLRNGVANVVSSAIHRYLETHSAILPFVDAADMQRYHDIYDLSRQDYQEMLQPLTPASEDDPESLRGLKTSLVRLFIARQILFCDLLALPSVSPMSDFRLWSVVSDEVANLSRLLRASATTLEHLVNEEDSRQWGDGWKAHSRGLTRPDKTQASENPAPETPGKQHVEAQLRRLDALSNSIRGLNAKMLLMRDEANNLIGDTAQSSDISSMLARQYDLIGADLKTLILEWENGRTTMLLSVGAFDRASLSRSSSELRSPRSPVHSLGGSTAVNEGSPAEAWKRLSGGSRDLSNDGLLSDEEVFEGVSLPPKVKRLSMMTREEKLAKMQEDRRKRATFQESRDATTNMLRELETVIKHRPRGRTTSRITTTT